MRKLMMMVLAGVLTVAFAGDVMAGKGKEKGKGDGKRDQFVSADADKDGKLSPTEFVTLAGDKRADKKFAAADTSKDGFLTPDELKAAREALGGKRGGKGKGVEGAGKGKQ